MTFLAIHGFIIIVTYYYETHALIHDKGDKFMANTYSKLMIHYIFSTKNRNLLLAESFREEYLEILDLHQIAYDKAYVFD